MASEPAPESPPPAAPIRSPAERLFRRVWVSIAGFTLLAIGTVLLVTPGPGVPIIVAGLALLALEYAWAKRWLKKVKETGRFLWQKASGGTAGSSSTRREDGVKDGVDGNDPER